MSGQARQKARPGAVITFGDGRLNGTILDVVEEGNRLIQFSYEGIFEEILGALGENASAAVHYAPAAGQKPLPDGLCET